MRAAYRLHSTELCDAHQRRSRRHVTIVSAARITALLGAKHVKSERTRHCRIGLPPTEMSIPPSDAAAATSCSTVRRRRRPSQYDMMCARLMRTSKCRGMRDLNQMIAAHASRFSCLVFVARQHSNRQDSMCVNRSSAGKCRSGMFLRDAQRHRRRAQASQCMQPIHGNPAACCDKTCVHQRTHGLRPQAAAITAALASRTATQAKRVYAPDVQQHTPVGLERMHSHRRRASSNELVMRTRQRTTTCSQPDTKTGKRAVYAHFAQFRSVTGRGKTAAARRRLRCVSSGHC